MIRSYQFVVKENPVWENGDLRIVEVRMFNTLEILTYKVEKLENERWNLQKSCPQFTDALRHVSNVMLGLNIDDALLKGFASLVVPR